MSLEWSVVSIWLYMEIGIICLFLVPYISPNMWSKVFGSDLASKVESYSGVYIWAGAGILLLLFADAVREVREYSDVDNQPPMSNAQADTLIHLRLFRAQRNLYVSFFALFLWIVILRMAALLKQEAEMQTEVERLSSTNLLSSTKALALQPADPSEIRKEIEAVNNTRKALVKQTEVLRHEFNRLSEERKALPANLNPGEEVPPTQPQQE